MPARNWGNATATQGVMALQLGNPSARTCSASTQVTHLMSSMCADTVSHVSVLGSLLRWPRGTYVLASHPVSPCPVQVDGI